VIVHDFDVIRVTRSPNEADTILIVDPNAVLPLTIAMQSLESVARRHPKIANVGGGMQHEKLAVGSLQHSLAPVCCDYYKNELFMTNLRANHAVYGLTLAFDTAGRIVPTPETCRDVFVALLDHRLQSPFSSNIYDVPDTTPVAAG
jgi:hypothetical protein